MKKRICTLLITLTAVANGISSQNSFINAYIKQAIASSYQLSAIRHEQSAQTEKIKGASQLQDLEFGLNIYPSPMQNVNGEQVGAVSVMQMFPFFGVLGSQRQEMQCMVNALDYKRQEIVNKIAEDVRLAYYDILLLNEKIKIAEQKKALFDKTETSLVQRTKSNGSITSIINLQLRKEEVNLQIANLQEDLKTAEEKFLILIHADGETEILLADTVEEHQPNILSVTQTQIADVSPKIKMLQSENTAAKHNAMMQQRMSYPMFGVGIDYMINKKTDMPKMEDMNGKNMFMLMFKATLPLNRKKYNANISSARFKSESILQNIEQTKDDLVARWLDLRTSYRNNKKLSELYDRQIRLIEENLKIIRTSYANNLASLSDLFALEEKLLDLKLKKAENTTEINKIIAKIKTLTENYEEI